MIEYHSNFLKADSHSFFETTCKDRIEIIRRGIRVIFLVLFAVPRGW